MSTTKKSQQLYQYSKLERPVRKDCNTNNKIHCTPCPQQTSSETKAEGWGGVGWGVGGVGVGVVIRCCRDMAAFLENNRPVHPVVHHWFIIFHFQLGSNPSHCRLETDYCQGQNIHLFTLPTGNGLLPGPKHPPLHTADWKRIIARAKTSASCSLWSVLLLHSVPGGPFVWPQVFQSLVCALYMYSTCPPGTEQYCPLSAFHSRPTLSLQTRMVSTDQRLPVPLLCHIQHRPWRTNAVPRLHLITGLSLSLSLALPRP